MRSSLVNATVLAIGSVLLLVVPSAAQSPIGLKVTFCSKANPNASPITGTLVGNDSTTYYKIFTPDYGEITLRRADVQDCGQRMVCPAGQEPGPAGCTCPANQTMQDGHCTSPRPAPVLANAPVTACRSFEDLAVQGSGTVGLGVMPFLIQGFANANSMRVTSSSDSQTQTRTYQLQGTDPACFRITVRSTGSDTAKDAIVDKVAQIGMSSRVYTDGEIQVLAKAAGAAPAVRSEIEQVVALDAVIVVVNKQNPVGYLSLCQIAEIFAGRIRNWRELGGRPGAIPASSPWAVRHLRDVSDARPESLWGRTGANDGLLARIVRRVACRRRRRRNECRLRARGFGRHKREGAAAARGVRHRADRQRVQHQDRGLSTRTTPVYLHALSARRLFAAAGEFHQGRRSRR